MKKKSGKLTTFLLILIFLAGMSLLLYPTVSDYVNALHSSRAISSYAAEISNMDEEEYNRIWQAAVDYNRSLHSRSNEFLLSEDQNEQYWELLKTGTSGVMGYIEIPAIEVSLPIYHGTDAGVLQVAVGHLDWTSLPTGGLGTHCVLSGHRGLPSAKLFTNLDKLAVKDVFMLRVLDEVLTYEVDQILIVNPNDVEALQIVEGQDYCTLVTCTPYGINTHRLLVRGRRIETEEAAAAIRITAEAVQVEPLIVATALGVPLLIIVLILMFSTEDRRTRRAKRYGGKYH